MNHRRPSAPTAFDRITARSPTVRAVKTISQLVKDRGLQKQETPAPAPASRAPQRAIYSPHALYTCRVTHHRLTPMLYKFAYRTFYMLFDLDWLPQLRTHRVLSYNRFNLFSFYDRDHGPRDGSPLRPWIEKLLREHGIELQRGRIRLLAMPRVLGYGFNPIALWYCEHRDRTLRAILVEVNNTHGDHHFYLLHRNGAPMDYAAPHRKAKLLHVSPLMDMRSEYRFRITEPQEILSLLIETYNPTPQDLMHVATLTGERQALSDTKLLRQFFRLPLMTLKVTSAIHWQALRIWAKGAKFQKDPGPPAQRVS